MPSACSSRPDGKRRGSVCPVARTLTFVPPMSIVSTFMEVNQGKSPVLVKSRQREAARVWPSRRRVVAVDVEQAGQARGVEQLVDFRADAAQGELPAGAAQLLTQADEHAQAD